MKTKTYKTIIILSGVAFTWHMLNVISDMNNEPNNAAWLMALFMVAGIYGFYRWYDYEFNNKKTWLEDWKRENKKRE